MRPDTKEWLDAASLEVLQCRDLRHAWPRNHAPVRGRSIKNTPDVRWHVEQETAGGLPRVLTREMDCIGQCGVTRIETFAVGIDGSMVRDGKPRYRHPSGYLRRRGKDQPYVEKIGPDELRGIVVRKIFPNLKW